MFSYTFLVSISLIIAFLLDQFLLKTKVYQNKKFYLLLVTVIFWQTVVDNWLNGRWGNGSFIVGPYGQEFYSGIRILFTPLENYFYGICLIWFNIILFEHFTKKPAKTGS